jgi:hypothetical protein
MESEDTVQTGAPQTDAPDATRPPEASLAVWDIAPAVAVGERFAVKVGAKSSAGCAMGGCRIEVLDQAGAVVGSGRLGEAPWPGTDALFWAELELRAPTEPGLITLKARIDTAAMDEPHEGASSPFSVSVVGRPEHTLTVKVHAAGAPVAEAYVRLGAYRAITDAAGVATVTMAKGRYELVVWKAGYDTPVTPLTIEADAVVQIEARARPEDDPDSHWTA